MNAIEKPVITRNLGVQNNYKSVDEKGWHNEWYQIRRQAMIPDFTLYSDPLTVTNFELFVVEVKKSGSFSNGHLETDIVKLGKEMQLALDKFIEKKVKSPKVVALLVECNKVGFSNST
ncbi:hypothetical protein CU097_008561 [Rhizopus azygosporus]|uniref:Uncharacterized protein n=1 Tax=Rhizopus azygosporus TaxID=86630 RepID=A0A367JAL7_RHIAZ|nr:hypothetical protein CU097_008561 [Rhizopus azygosporus]